MNKDSLKLSYLIVILLFLFSTNIHAQYFLTGQDPATVKWDQIKTKYYRIIYPRDYAEMAQYYINVLTLSGKYVTEPYLDMDKEKRISVILHNQTTSSNAMVPIAPFRADFYEMPPQNSYPQIWQDQLTLHEYRHVVHINNMRQGTTKGLYYVFGEQGIAAVMGLWLPFWFIEGDAVYSETIFSNSGRGREPAFIYPLKAQVLDLKIYKYDKAVYGSFNDFVPDHYTLGYQMVTKGIEEYGIGLWDWTIDRVARRPYYMVPFTTAVKKQTGKFKVQLYNNFLKSLRTEWWINDKPEIDSAIQFRSPENRFYTNYLFPTQLADGSIVAEKTSIDDINRFVMVDPEGNEKRIFTPGYDLKEALSVSDSILCWNERGYDPRWDMRNYSVIKVYNLKTGKLKKLTSKTRYFAPNISHDAKKIVVVYVSRELEYSLHILDTETGQVLNKIRTQDSLFFMTPQWSDDDQHIVAMVLGKKGKSLIKVNAETSEMDFLLPFSYKEIKRPAMHGKWIVYTATYEGKDNLYAIDVKTRKVYRVFESRFGATNATFSKDGKSLVSSYYSSNGYKLATIPFDTEKLEEVNLSEINYVFRADRLTTPQTFNLDDSIVPNKDYPTKRYRKGGHLFNLHSWAPLAVDANNYTINPGAMLMSQNLLSSTVTTLSYLYDINEQTSKIKFGFDYYGWYPVIGLSVDYGGRRVNIENKEGEIVELNWRETNISLNVSVPLNFTSSKWIQGMRPSIGIDQKFLNMKTHGYKFKEDRITAPIYRFYAYNQYKTSPKDLYPHWGQSIDLIYRNTPLSDSVSSQAALIGWVYFPGFVRHQGIRIYGGYQKTITGNYSFSNILAAPRGYTNVSYPEYFSVRSDYAFPIAYPDWNVPGAFYLKRIYSKLFYDYLQGYDQGKVQELSSTGIELYTDWHFLSILVGFNLGVRVSHRFFDNTQRYEFLFGFNINY